MCEQHSSPTHYSAQNNLGPEPSSLMKSPPSQKSFPESSAPHCTLDFGTFIVSVIVRLLYPWDCKLSYSRAWASTQHLSTQEFTSIHMNEINTDSLITESGGLFHPSSKTPFADCSFHLKHSSHHSFLHSSSKYLWLWTTCWVLFQKPGIDQWRGYKFLRKVHFGGEDRCRQRK